MSACEKCWRDASQRALLLGGSVTEHYHVLLEKRRDNPCPPISVAAENQTEECAQEQSNGTRWPY